MNIEANNRREALAEVVRSLLESIEGFTLERVYIEKPARPTIFAELGRSSRTPVIDLDEGAEEINLGTTRRKETGKIEVLIEAAAIKPAGGDPGGAGLLETAIDEAIEKLDRALHAYTGGDRYTPEDEAYTIQLGRFGDVLEIPAPEESNRTGTALFQVDLSFTQYWW